MTGVQTCALPISVKADGQKTIGTLFNAYVKFAGRYYNGKGQLITVKLVQSFAVADGHIAEGVKGAITFSIVNCQRLVNVQVDKLPTGASKVIGYVNIYVGKGIGYLGQS